VASQNMEDAVRDWVRSEAYCKSAAQEALKAREQKEKNANILAKIVIPEDAKSSEIFCVWVRTGFRQERLLSVKVGPRTTARGGAFEFDVSFRSEDRTLDEKVDVIE